MRYILGLLAAIVVGAMFSCSEKEEENIFDHWQDINEALADSLLAEARGNLFSQGADTTKIDAMPLDDLFAIQTRSSTSKKKEYVFCKKLTATKGRHPLYTDRISAFYCGSYITGNVFDSNFDGYVATDVDMKGNLFLPAVYDTPTTFEMQNSSYGLIEGWIAALQFMREGERWVLYVPYQSGYGKNGSSDGSVIGYSMLVFDIILDEILDK